MNSLPSKIIKAKDVKKGDVICHRDWRRDIKVFDVTVEGTGVRIIGKYISNEDKEMQEILYPTHQFLNVIQIEKH